MIRPCALLVSAVLSGCVGTAAVPRTDGSAPAFAPLAFFAGRTEGLGRLRIAMSGTRTVHVLGEGRVGSDGMLTLIQRVDQQGKPVRDRIWSLRPTSDGRYEGTLSDAVGPVAAMARGNMLHIRYKAAGGVDVEQWLALQPGGRIARNRLVARKFGVRVAALEETIRKID